MCTSLYPLPNLRISRHFRQLHTLKRVDEVNVNFWVKDVAEREFKNKLVDQDCAAQHASLTDLLPLHLKWFGSRFVPVVSGLGDSIVIEHGNIVARCSFRATNQAL